MATTRLTMRKTKEILRQKWVLELSHRAVAASVGVSLGVVSETISRAQAANLDWAGVATMSDPDLERRLYPPAPGPGLTRPLPEMATIHLELRRKHVTLQLLHFEYLERHPDGYGYTQFCEHYHRFERTHGLVMRQVHRAGERMFVDYSGKRPHVVDPKTGEVIEVELFVAVLGASSYTFAEATRSQRSPDFIASHIRALEYFGGVTELFVPDQLKSGVTVACRYEPGVQRTYAEMAIHYGAAVMPARPRRPRDKAKVEVAVQVVQRWILARLRHQTFFSLEALNERIAELLEDLNARPMRAHRKSRHELFVLYDQPALRPLPAERFTYCEWKRVAVNIDYHVEVDGHYYSVPHRYRGYDGEIEARFSAGAVEILAGNQRIALHARSHARGKHTTTSEHMPAAHRAHAEWSPSRILHWAATLGPSVEGLCAKILHERAHPEQGYRSCLGLIRLEKRYGKERLDRACARALAVRALSYRSVASILERGLDHLPLPDAPTERAAAADHENIRGPEYYN